MTSDRHIVSYTLEELAAMRANGEDRTDWDEAKTMTEADVEAAIASDDDEAGMVVDWAAARISVPTRKRMMTMRLDSDVLDFFQGMGRGYQTTINAVLRSYMEHAKR